MMRELLREKGLQWAILLCFLIIVSGFPFYELEIPLNSGSFVSLYQKTLKTQTLLFFIPIVSVLPLGASYVRESASGFLKSYIVRINRIEYVKRKTVGTFTGGFLPFFVGGILSLFLCFLLLYPLELRGSVPWETVLESVKMLLRISFVGGILAELSGIFAVIFQNYYMAYGLPFVCYYLLIILKERYLPNMYAMYPREWIVCQQNWGLENIGIWFFLFVFLGAVMLLHSLLLYGKLREI